MGQITAKKGNSDCKKPVKRILLADDEQVFRESTAELLRKEGYYCDCASDAFDAIEFIKQNPYDLLIADIKMPGNPELELIKKLSEVAGGMPVIIVTAFPSQKSAIESIHLPVTAYMIKPVDFAELEKNIAEALVRRNLFLPVINTEQRLAAIQKHIQDIEGSLKEQSRRGFSASVKNFLDWTLGNINWAMSDIKNLTYILTSGQDEPVVCNLLNCPRLEELAKSLRATIRALEKTRSSFKSKELGQLRIKLEQLLKKAEKV